MKIFTHILLLFFIGSGIYSLENPAVDSEEYATVYIMRDTDRMGALTNFKVFLDDNLICELKNYHYIQSKIPSGDHKFSVQMSGKKAKESVEHFELSLETDKTYYLKVETPGSVMGSSSFIEITDNSAEKLLPKLTVQEDCK